MSRIKISHEVPLCLLGDSKRFNDYQFCLPHLMESDEEYRNHFLQCKEEGIEIYLDNSLHELGYSMDDEVLLKWIDIIRPTNFFVPDVWGDKTKTLVNSKRWSNIEVPEETLKVPIIQVASQAEALEMYHIFKMQGYEKIAFTYGLPYYRELSNHPNKDIALALGRIMAIGDLESKGIIGKTDKIHLLGTASPFEFAFYSEIPNIESIDTSNPIMTTLDNKAFNKMGNHNKPISSMNNNFEMNLEDIDLDLLYYNIDSFRSIVDLSK